MCLECCTDTVAHPDIELSASILLGGFSWSYGCEASRCTTSFSSPSSSDSSPTSSTLVLSVLLVTKNEFVNSFDAGTTSLFGASTCQCVYPRYPKTGNDYPVGLPRNILNICHQSLRCKQGSSLVSPRKLGNTLLSVLRMNSTSSTLDFCLRKDLGRYLCLYWDYSRCQRVYPCLLVSNTMDVLPGIANTLYLSHQLQRCNWCPSYSCHRSWGTRFV